MTAHDRHDSKFHIRAPPTATVSRAVHPHLANMAQQLSLLDGVSPKGVSFVEHAFDKACEQVPWVDRPDLVLVFGPCWPLQVRYRMPYGEANVGYDHLLMRTVDGDGHQHSRGWCPCGLDFLSSLGPVAMKNFKWLVTRRSSSGPESREEFDAKMVELDAETRAKGESYEKCMQQLLEHYCPGHTFDYEPHYVPREIVDKFRLEAIVPDSILKWGKECGAEDDMARNKREIVVNVPTCLPLDQPGMCLPIVISAYVDVTTDQHKFKEKNGKTSSHSDEAEEKDNAPPEFTYPDGSYTEDYRLFLKIMNLTSQAMTAIWDHIVAKKKAEREEDEAAKAEEAGQDGPAEPSAKRVKVE